MVGKTLESKPKESYQIIQEWDGLYYVNYCWHYSDHIPYAHPMKLTEYGNDYAAFKTIEEAESFIKFHRENKGYKIIKTFTYETD